MTKMMKRAMASALLVMSMGVLAGCGNDDNLGYVDTNKAIQQSPKYKEIMTKMEERSNQIQTRLKTAESSQTPEAYKKTKASAEQEFALFRSAMYKELQSYVENNVASIAKEKKLTIVVDKNAVTSGGTDITDELIKKMGTTNSSDQSQTQSQTQTQSQDQSSAKTTQSEGQK